MPARTRVGPVALVGRGHLPGTIGKQSVHIGMRLGSFRTATDTAPGELWVATQRRASLQPQSCSTVTLPSISTHTRSGSVAGDA